MLLVDFSDPGESTRWRPVDDVVMGGRSSSAIRAGEGIGIFTGELSLDRGGGFASVRREDQTVDLSAFEAIELRVRGDGKRYRLNLRTSSAFDGVVFQGAFATEPFVPSVTSVWQAVWLPLPAFVPRFRGRPASGTFDPSRVTGLGLLIADGQVGPFRLEVSGITAASRFLSA